MDFLRTEIFCRQPLYLYERAEHDFHTIFFGNFEIRRFFGFGLRLRN